MSQSIIQGFGGVLLVQSELGHGSTFIVRLPVVASLTSDEKS